MNKKIILTICVLLILINYAYAQYETDLDKKINSGQDLTTDEYGKLSTQQKETYINIKVSQGSDLSSYEIKDFIKLYDPQKTGHKEAFRKIATKEDFKVSTENRDAIKKHLTSLDDFNDKQDQDIFIKTAVQDIDIINKNRETFQKYVASFQPPVNSFEFHEKSKGFESFDSKTGFLTPHGDPNKRTLFSLDLLQKYVNIKIAGFELGQDGELIIKYDKEIKRKGKLEKMTKEFTLSGVDFDKDETGKIKVTNPESKYPSDKEPIIKSGRISSSDFNQIEIPSNCKSCSATIDNEGIFTVYTQDLPIQLPVDQNVLLSGTASLIYESDEMPAIIYGENSRFKNNFAEFKVSRDTGYNAGRVSFYWEVGEITFGYSIIVSNPEAGILEIAAGEGEVSVKLPTDNNGNPQHPYKLVNAIGVKGNVIIEEGNSRVEIKRGNPTFQGDLPKTPVYSEGYYISEKGLGRCDIQCYETLNSLKPIVSEQKNTVDIKQIKEDLNSEDHIKFYNALQDIGKLDPKLIQEDPDLVDALLKVIYQNIEPGISRDTTQGIIAKGLSEFFIPKLKEGILNSDDKNQIKNGMNSIARIIAFTESQSGVKALDELAKSDNKFIRYEAAYKLGFLSELKLVGTTESDYYSILGEMLLDPEIKDEENFPLKESIAGIIGGSDTPPAKVFAIIAKGIKSEDESIKESSLFLFNEMKDKLVKLPEMRDFVIRNLNTENYELKAIIGHYVVKNRDFPNRLEILKEYFNDRNVHWEVRLDAFENLVLDEKLRREIIISALDDNEHIVKFYALRATLDYFNEEESKEITKRKLLDSDEQTRVEAAELLAGYFGDDEGFDALERIAKEDKSQEAIRALGKMESQRAASILLDIYRTSDNPKMVSSSFNAIRSAKSEVFNDALLQIAKEPKETDDGLTTLEKLLEKRDSRYIEAIDILFKKDGDSALKLSITREITNLDDDNSRRVLSRIMNSDEEDLKPIAANSLAKSKEGRQILLQTNFLGDVNSEVLESKIGKIEDGKIKPSDLYFISKSSDEELGKSREDIISDTEGLLSGLSNTKRTDSNGWYEEDFKYYRDTLPNVVLLKIKKVLEALQDFRTVEQIGNLMEKDIADKNTEYGGIVKIDDKGKAYFDFYTPKLARMDGGYLHSASFSRDIGKSIADFHFHALSDDESKAAGPSGLPDSPGGDLGVAIATRTDGIVITSIDKGCFNVDFYTPDLAVIDLGNYCKKQ